MFTIPEWPEEFVKHYTEKEFWNDETFGNKFRTVCELNSENIAIVDQNNRMTFRQLAASVLKLAKGLQSIGLNQGDVVIVQLPNSARFIEVIFALFCTGIIPVFALPTHREKEITAFARFTSAKACIVADSISGVDIPSIYNRIVSNLPELKYIIVDGKYEGLMDLDSLPDFIFTPPKIKADALVCFQLSGGTTGIPKLIPRRHRDYLYNIRASIDACNINTSTKYMAILPLSHNFSMVSPGFLGTLFSGGSVIIGRQADPEYCFHLIEKEKVTITSLVPPLVIVWLEYSKLYQLKLPSNLILQVGGARFSEKTARQIKPILGCKLQQVFGMAEGLNCYTRSNDPYHITIKTQGKPVSPADEIRVVDVNGNDVSKGELGYLLTRGPYTIRGYVGVETINAHSFTDDGFYRSGDLIRQTSDGYIIVEGRDNDQINRNGEKIDINEIEDCLLSHPDVLDVAVVGIPDKYLGESIYAFIKSKKKTLIKGDLRDFIKRQGLASFKIPDHFEIKEDLEVTGIGKISRKQLREILTSRVLKGKN